MIRRSLPARPQRRTPMRPVASALGIALVATLATGLTPAVADSAPEPPVTVRTVTSDSLPTVQINGVVWDQVIVGNRVYVTGNFSQARPAGAAPGTNQTPRSNILAYDLTTGNLVTSWAPSLNGQGLAIDASADGSRIYVGGSFTAVNGTTRNRIAALDATSGTLIGSFNPNSNASVYALDVADNVVYLGGPFGAVGGQARTRVAAVNATTGAVLPFAPQLDSAVTAISAPPGKGTVVVGGRFRFANGQDVRGLAAFNATDASLKPWPSYGVFPNYGPNSSFESLESDGTQVYGTGYDYGGPSQFEGSFAIDLASGAVNWVNACRGDTYDAVPIGEVLYTVGHAHDCAMIGGLPQTQPWTYQRALATTTYPGTDGRVNTSGPYRNRPAPELLHWTPDFTAGTFTGQTQAGWAVTGNSEYVVIGGEFPRVNRTAQQGLSRFRVNGPNSDDISGYADLRPSLASFAPGTVRAGWTAAWDRDNENLTYEVLRGESLGSATVVGTVRSPSVWWERPQLSFTDRSAPPGTTQTYRIRVRDVFGNQLVSETSTIEVPGGPGEVSAYSNWVRADGAANHWRLGEPSGTSGYDWVGAHDLNLGPGATRGTAGALTESNTATTFSGSAQVPATTTTTTPGPATFSVEAWIKTTTTAGGKIVGFGNSTTGTSTSYDRHLYMNAEGRVVFGVYPGTVRTLNSQPGLNDGRWHHIVGTLGPSGMELYVDSRRVGARFDTTSAQDYSGVWRVGGDNLNGWPTRPTSDAFAGAIDEVATYPSALSAAQVRNHYDVARGAVSNLPPSAAFTSQTEDLTASFDASTSSDPDGTITSYAWDFGDDTTGTGASPEHTYDAAGSYTVRLTVTDNGGATSQITSSITVTEPVPDNESPTAAFTSQTEGLTASFDASTSSDPDGTIASYAWDFGDDTTGTGDSPTRTYEEAGTYTVTLTVTDDDGATDQSSRTVTVTEDVDPPAGLAADTFTRTSTSGLGAADSGGSWSLGGGSSADYTVADGVGRIRMPSGGAQRSALLNAVSSTDTDLTLSLALDKQATGGGVYVSTIGRNVEGAGHYSLKSRFLSTGEIQLSLVRTAGGSSTLTSATVPGITYSAGEVLRVRLQVTGAGSTTLRAKVWRDGSPEPASWQVSATDSTASLQAPGGIGLISYLSGSATNPPVTTLIDDLLAQPTGQ